MRYSHALRLVPSANWWKAEEAFTNVSWTRSSASAGLRVIRSAAGYSWSRNGSASRSKRASRSARVSATSVRLPPSRASGTSTGAPMGALAALVSGVSSAVCSGTDRPLRSPLTRGTTSVDPSRAASGRPGGRRCAGRGRAVETVLLTTRPTEAGAAGIPGCRRSLPPWLGFGAVAATPAVAVLVRAKVAHTLHPYDAEHPSDQGHGEAAVTALGADPRQVFKTLLARVDGALTVAVVPVAGTLDLKALATATGGKKAAMADPADAERTTGYVLGGISPLAQKKVLPTVVDDSALTFATVLVSAGKRGLQVELPPGDLVRLTRARTAPIGR